MAKAITDTKDPLFMWEILVPTTRPDGRPIKTRFHRRWDAEVYKLCGGLTILTPTKGKWICPAGELFEERMIPVRIVATRAQINAIVDLTIRYYEQKAVLAVMVGMEVLLKHAPSSDKPEQFFGRDLAGIL